MGSAAVFLLLRAFSGPSASKALKRRMELVKERHAEGVAANAQAQIRKLMAARASRIEGFASSIIPKPALLRKRLEMTGKNITLAKYAMISGGIAFVVMALLMLRGAPLLLALFAGLFVGVGGPHFVVGKMIKRRINKFTANFPDAIELMVRGLRSGLPITETLGDRRQRNPGPGRGRVPHRLRQDEDRPDDGSRAAGNRRPPRHRRIPVLRHHAGDPARDRRQPCRDLSNLADVLRKRAQMKLKIRAMSSESKASAYIVGSLPFIVFALVWMINPEYMAGFFIDQRLIVAGLGGLVWMSIGVFIMAKMVNFEI